MIATAGCVEPKTKMQNIQEEQPKFAEVYQLVNPKLLERKYLSLVKKSGTILS